jgi:hypothetical protein
VTAIGGLLVAWYTHTSQAHDQKSENARAAASAWAQAHQAAQGVRDQNRAEQLDLLKDLAPRVSGTMGSNANCSLVLGLWDSVYPGATPPVLTSACQDAGIAQAEQHWGVAVGNQATELVACHRAGWVGAKLEAELSAPERVGLVAARVFCVEDLYQTVVGDYASKSEAEPIASFVRVALGLDGLVVPLDPNTFHTCGSAGCR